MGNCELWTVKSEEWRVKGEVWFGEREYGGLGWVGDLKERWWFSLFDQKIPPFVNKSDLNELACPFPLFNKSNLLTIFNTIEGYFTPPSTSCFCFCYIAPTIPPNFRFPLPPPRPRQRCLSPTILASFLQYPLNIRNVKNSPKGRPFHALRP
jgi:hypothetical protein